MKKNNKSTKAPVSAKKKKKTDYEVLSNKLNTYRKLLGEIKDKVRSSQLKAVISVNKELIKLYWEIGSSVLKKQQEEGWGSKTIERLAKDLRSTFIEMKGFSFRNIQYMVAFAREYPDAPITQQPVAQIPWGHNTLLLDKVKDRDLRLWYAQKTIENGWSRSVLLNWLDSELHKRQGKALTNFKKTLPSPHSDLAHETLKDPYSFDFIELREKFDEKELETGLINHVKKFLFEMGDGLAFVGQQINLNIDGHDFFVDLLLYNYKLRYFMVVELKTGEFKPEYAGKMNFYLTAVDKIYKHKDDHPTIGLLLCKTRSKIIAEYALQDIKKPLGVAEYKVKLIESLPKNLRSSLPTIEEIEAEFEKDIKHD